MVVPGVGPVHAGHASTAVGLVRGVASQVGRTHPGDPGVAAVAMAAHDDPARHGPDLVLATHAPRHYAERLRTGRLPSHAWAEHGTPARFERHLRRVHEEIGPELARRYGHLPLGERQLIGLAAANGAHGDVVRGLDALRAHPHYPARSSWHVLTRGFAPHDVARIASEIVPGGSVEPVVEAHRALRREHAERYRVRRRALLRGLREMWVSGAPALVPVFHMLARGMSPEQIERFRAELARNGDVEGVLDQIESANLEARLASEEAAVRRFLAEHEHNRDPAATTPMDEAHARPAGDGRADRGRTDRARSARGRADHIHFSARGSAPGEALDLEWIPEDDDPGEAEADEHNADAGAVRGGGMRGGGRGGRRVSGGRGRIGGRWGGPGRGWWGGGPVAWDFLPESEDDDDADDADDNDDAGAVGSRAIGGVKPAAVAPLRAPSPGAHAADGVLPLSELVQGFGHAGRQELARAWDRGAAWETYQDLLVRRGEIARAAREGEFLRRLEALGCALPGPCALDLAEMSHLSDLGEHFTPQQWAWLTAALSEGTADPLGVWRGIEAENFAEAVATRLPAFLRHYGAWGRSPRWNPATWEVEVPRLARVVLDGDAAGLLDDIGGAIGALAGGDGDGGGNGGGGGLSGLFGGGGPSVAQIGQLAGLAGKVGAAIPQIQGFAQHAVAQLTGRTEPPGRPPEGAPPHGAPPAPPRGAPPAPPRGAPPAPARGARGAARHHPPDLHGVDMANVLARWGNPRSRVHHLGIEMIRGLAAIGLTELASGPPRELLRMIPRPVPRKGTDPSKWWHVLTAEQGIDPQAAMALRTVIDESGPQGTQAILAAYHDALQGPLNALKARREELFARILAAAQKAVGAAAFDPHKLPGGSPFVLFDAHVPEGDGRLLDDAIRSGQGLDGFREFEDAREQRLLVEASERMAEMLATLWSMRASHGGEAERGAAPPGAEGSEPREAGADAGDEAGANVGAILGNIFTGGLYGAVRAATRPDHDDRWRRGRGGRGGRDHEALERFHGHPGLGRVLERRGSIDRRFMGRMHRRGEAGAPEAGFEEAGAPGFEAAGAGDAGEAGFEAAGAGDAGFPRPTPLYHLSFNRPMSRREFGRLLQYVPQLRAHPEGVLREIAGLRSQARDVRGLNALTGEYHLLPGESYRDIALKLVGDPRRWHELHFANPARVESDPLVRVPPGWFGYIQYQIPAHLVHEHLRLREAAGVDEAGEDAGELDEAGLPRRRSSRRRGPGSSRHHAGTWQGQGSGLDPEDDESSGLFDKLLGIFGRGSPAPTPAIKAEPPPPAEDLPIEPETPGTPLAARPDRPFAQTGRTTYKVEARGEGMWRIAQKFHAASRAHWFAELRDANPHKTVAVDETGKQLGWAWLNAGETINIPDVWKSKWFSELRNASVAVPKDATDTGSWEDVGAPNGPHRAVLAEDTIVRTRPGGDICHRLTADWPVLVHERQGTWCRITYLVGPNGARCDFSDRCSVATGWAPFASVDFIDANEASGVDEEAGDPTRRTYKVTAADVANPFALAAKAGVNPLDPAVQAAFKAANPGVDQPKAGDIVNIPDTWPERPGMYQTRAPNAAVPTAPPASAAPKTAAPKTAAPKTTVPTTVVAKASVPKAVAPSGRAIDEDALRQNTTKNVYAVQPGDGMWQIAQKLGAASRAHWFAELRDANPHKKILTDPATGKQLRFERLYPGKLINIPDVWPESPALRPAPGGEPTARPIQGIELAPTLAGGVTPALTAPPGTIPAAASIDPGTWHRVQLYLIQFGQAHRDEIDPRDYGSGTPLALDTLGQPQPRDRRALASFQVFANRTAGTKLRTDGMIDPATIAALDSFHLQIDGEPHLRPAPTPIPGAPMPPPSAPYRPVLEGAPHVAADPAPPAPEPRRPGPTPAPAPRPPPPRRPVDPSDPFFGTPGVAGRLAREAHDVAPPAGPPAPPAPPPRPREAHDVAPSAGPAAPPPRPREARDMAPPTGPAAPPTRPRGPRIYGSPPPVLSSDMAREYERLHPAPAPVEELPVVVAERDAPRPVSLPGGAPHAPPPRASDARPPLRVTPDPRERLQREGTDLARVAGGGPEAPPPEPAPRPKKKSEGDAAPIVGGALLGGLVGGPIGAAAGLVLGLLASEDPKPKGPPPPAQERA